MSASQKDVGKLHAPAKGAGGTKRDAEQVPAKKGITLPYRNWYVPLLLVKEVSYKAIASWLRLPLMRHFISGMSPQFQEHMPDVFLQGNVKGKPTANGRSAIDAYQLCFFRLVNCRRVELPAVPARISCSALIIDPLCRQKIFTVAYSKENIQIESCLGSPIKIPFAIILKPIAWLGDLRSGQKDGIKTNLGDTIGADRFRTNF